MNDERGLNVHVVKSGKHIQLRGLPKNEYLDFSTGEAERVDAKG